MTYNEHWIPVSISAGMFSSERAISLTLANGDVVSFFADNVLLKEEAGHSLLRVFRVGGDPAQRRQRVLLPTETFETASRWVEVAI